MKTIYSKTVSSVRQLEVFCLYGDIINFSKISKECLAEKASVTAMKAFYSETISTIEKNKGVTICFMGDGFLCVWEKDISSNWAIQTIKEITSNTAKLLLEWKSNTSGSFKLPTGIRFGAIMAHVALFVGSNNRILNAYGNQLNLGARYLSAKGNRQNCICLSRSAADWLGLNANTCYKDHKVKKDKFSAAILPVVDL